MEKSIPKQLKLKGQHQSLEKTTHNRVLIETSDRANELARRWNTTKQEVYRWLIDLAYEGEIEPLQGKLEK